MDIHFLGRVDYRACHAAMQRFTATRDGDTPDALWVCEHEPVYTQGLAGQARHILDAGAIPVVQSDRGGQVTYHGPGQVVAYALIDLRRAGYYVKEYVYRVEEAALKTLGAFGVTGHRVRGAPGVYVRTDDPFDHAPLSGVSAPQLGSAPHLAKIAALGIKVSRHCTYHGIAFNVAMDLTPFERIHPCGHAGLKTTDLSTIGIPVDWEQVADSLSQKLATYLRP